MARLILSDDGLVRWPTGASKRMLVMTKNSTENRIAWQVYWMQCAFGDLCGGPKMRIHFGIQCFRCHCIWPSLGLYKFTMAIGVYSTSRLWTTFCCIPPGRTLLIRRVVQPKRTTTSSIRMPFVWSNVHLNVLCLVFIVVIADDDVNFVVYFGVLLSKYLCLSTFESPILYCLVTFILSLRSSVFSNGLKTSKLPSRKIIRIECTLIFRYINHVTFCPDMNCILSEMLVDYSVSETMILSYGSSGCGCRMRFNFQFKLKFGWIWISCQANEREREDWQMVWTGDEYRWVHSFIRFRWIVGEWNRFSWSESESQMAKLKYWFSSEFSAETIMNEFQSFRLDEMFHLWARWWAKW